MSDSDYSSDVLDRPQLLGLLEIGIRETTKKVDSGRVYDAENERIRIKWIRALSKLVESHRKVLNDHREAELEARLDELDDRLAEIESAEGVLGDG